MRRNLMNALGLAVMTAIVLPAAADAQQPRMDRGQRMGAPAARLIEQREALGLTDEQVAELRRIEADLEQKNAQLLEQLRANRAASIEQMNTVLTPEQQQKVKELRPARREGPRGERRPRGDRSPANGPPGER